MRASENDPRKLTASEKFVAQVGLWPTKKWRNHGQGNRSHWELNE